jgi:2-keto-4-pentenoate hydratase/2-oxohepta-3-ene-1,7-dioic acid hydratase in catechol pathway
MRYSIPEAIAHVSQSEQLYPGELISTGTLPGGSGMELGRWLRPGDELRPRDSYARCNSNSGITRLVLD